MHFVFSIWPPVAVNMFDFLVDAIDGSGGGGGYRRNTQQNSIKREKNTPESCSSYLKIEEFNAIRPKRGKK